MNPQFIGAPRCELEVWGFKDVNDCFFCTSRLYTLGRFHKNKLVGLSKFLIYYLYMGDIMSLLLALLLVSSKQPGGEYCSVGTTEVIQKASNATPGPTYFS